MRIKKEKKQRERGEGKRRSFLGERDKNSGIYKDSGRRHRERGRNEIAMIIIRDESRKRSARIQSLSIKRRGRKMRKRKGDGEEVQEEDGESREMDLRAMREDERREKFSLPPSLSFFLSSSWAILPRER